MGSEHWFILLSIVCSNFHGFGVQGGMEDEAVEGTNIHTTRSMEEKDIRTHVDTILYMASLPPGGGTSQQSHPGHVAKWLHSTGP